MGSVVGLLGGFASQAACCFGSAAVSCCCKSCPACTSSTSTRIVYAVLLLALAIAAWLMLTPKIYDRLDYMAKYTGSIDCADERTDCNKLWGQLGVFRVMFGSTLFFTLMALLMIKVKSSQDGRSALQNGMWGPKLLLLTGIIVGAFFIDNSFFFGTWGYIGLIGAFFFIIIQMILLIDFAHAWADSWICKMEESRCYAFALIFATAVLYLTAFVGIVLMFVYYGKSSTESCGLHKFYIAFALILCIACTIVSLLPAVKEALPKTGLLQSAVISFYITYLTWSAVSNTLGGTCHPDAMTSNDTATTVIGAMLTFLAVCYSSLRTSSASQLGKLGMGGDAEAAYLLAEKNDDDESGGQTVVDNEEEAVTYNWSLFHLIFALASLYLMMVLTNFATLKDGYEADFHVGTGTASAWVNIVSSWITALLYIWSLVAPLILSDRTFLE